MPWKEETTMSQKLRFTQLALSEEVSFSDLCKRFRISRTTGYKWLNRYKEDGPEGLKEVSRAPISNPNKTSASIEKRIIAVRLKHPAWGGEEKLKCILCVME